MNFNNSSSNTILDQQHIEILIKSFRLALTNIRMYPVTSTLVEKPISDFYSIIKQLCTFLPEVVIAELDNKIYVNTIECSGREALVSANQLVQIFIQAGIKSITFRPNITLEELKEILIALSTKKQKTTTKELLKQVIQEKGIQNVAIDEVEFITVSKSDSVVKSILNQLSVAPSNLSELMNILSNVYTELDKVTNKETKQQIQEKIVKYISSLDAQTISDLFSQPLPPKIEQSGLKQQVFNNLTKQKVEETFNEIITWCKRLRNEVSSEIEYLEKLSHLRDFIRLVINSPVSKLIPIEIFEELFKVGLIDVLPEWVTEKKQKKSWIAELDELLNSNEPVKLLQESFITSLNDTLDKLCVIGLDDKIEKITTMMVENLQNPVIKLRQLASSSLNTITKQIVKYGKDAIVRKLVGNIINLLIKEQDETVVKQYIEIFFDSFVSMIIAKDYQTFIDYAQQLLKFALELYSVSSEKSKLIYDMFNKVFNSTKEILGEDFASGKEEYIIPILWFLNYIGDNSIEILVSTSIKTENVKVRQMILNILKDRVEKVAEVIKKMVTPKTPSREINKIIDILNQLDYDFSETFISLFPYTTYANKIAIINYVYKYPTEHNIEWLVSLLDSDDLQIIEYIVDIITSLEISSSVPKLIKLLKTDNIDIKKRVCVALGTLKNVIAVKPLRKILMSRPKFFGLIKGQPMELRMVACWALGNFITLPEIKSLFIKIANSKDQPIANSVKEMLQKNKII